MSSQTKRTRKDRDEPYSDIVVPSAQSMSKLARRAGNPFTRQTLSDVVDIIRGAAESGFNEVTINNEIGVLEYSEQKVVVRILQAAGYNASTYSVSWPVAKEDAAGQADDDKQSNHNAAPGVSPSSPLPPPLAAPVVEAAAAPVAIEPCAESKPIAPPTTAAHVQ